MIDRDEETIGNFGGDPGRDADEDLMDSLLAEYIDRFNLGDSISPSSILAAHPRLGPEIIERLGAFFELDGDSSEDAAAFLRKLGNYQLIRRIGAGGMGVVYEAWEPSLERMVALKVLPASSAIDGTLVKRFLREARAAAKLKHQNIVTVHGLGLSSGTPYYAMELVDGETLAALRTRLGLSPKLLEDEPRASAVLRELLVRLPAPPGEEGDAQCLEGLSLPTLRARYVRGVAQTFSAVARGLQHAHECGVIHRDLKPSNLILDHQRRLRILDFGLARVSGDQSLTIDGRLLGTPLYMSPEQMRSVGADAPHLDRRTDIYSLGLTFYEVLAWRHPFAGRSLQEIHRATLEEDPPPLGAGASRDLEAIVFRCLEKSADRRYGTAEALAQDLDRYIRAEPVEARPRPRWRRGVAKLWARRRAVAWAALALVGAFALYQGARWYGEGLGPRESRLSEEPPHSTQHRVSRNGAKAVSIDWGTDGNVRVLDLVSGRDWRLTDNGFGSAAGTTHEAETLVVSPDGERVAYWWETLVEGATSGLFIAGSAEGSLPEALPGLGPGYWTVDDWSANGSTLLAERYSSGSRSFVLLDPETGASLSEQALTGSAKVRRGRLRGDEPVALFEMEEAPGSGGYDIWQMDLESGALERLRGGLSDDMLDAVSADGRLVYFTSDRSGALELFRARYDGSALTPTNERLWSRGHCVDVSLDGKVYILESNRQFDLTIASLGGAPGVTLAHGEPGTELHAGKAVAPCWSPDGTRLAFRASRRQSAAHEDVAFLWDLVVRTVEPPEERTIETTPRFARRSRRIGPCWLDDQTLLIGASADFEPFGLYRVDLSMGKADRVPLAGQLHDIHGSFCAADDTIWYTDAGTQSIRRLRLADGSSGPPSSAVDEIVVRMRASCIAVSPDRSWLAFSSGGALWRAPAGGGEPIELRTARAGPGAIQSSGGLEWTLDGRSVVLLTAGRELRQVDVASGADEALATLQGNVADFALHPAGLRVALVSESGSSLLSVLENLAAP